MVRPPPEKTPAIFLQRAFHGRSTRGKDAMKTKKSSYDIFFFLVCRGRSNDDVRGGGARGTVFQEIRPGAGFKTGDFVEKKSWRGLYRTTTQIFATNLGYQPLYNWKPVFGDNITWI